MARGDRSRSGDPGGSYAALKERTGSSRSAGSWPPPGVEAPTSDDPLDVWETLDDRLDPGQDRPKIAPDVDLTEFKMRWGNDYAIARNPRELLHYRLTPDEARLFKLMDGSRTVRELVVDQMEGSGELELDSVATFVADLYKGGFLVKPFTDVPALLEEHLSPLSSLRAKLRVAAKTLSVEWSGAERMVRWIHDKILRYAFTPAFGVMSLGIVVGGLVAFVATESSGRFGLLGQSSTADSLILIAMGYVLTLCHELGHALVLIHEDRRIKNAGLMIYFGSPTFFVDASDGLVLASKYRIMQAAAGPYAELIVAGAAALIVAIFPNGPASSVLYKFCLLNYFVCFLNLIPLLELDGYFILSDFIQVPDLRPRSLEFLQHESLQKLRSRSRWSPQEVGLFTYAVVGVLFSIFCLVTGVIFWWAVFGGLIHGLWNGGILGKLLLIVLIVVLVGPALRGVTALVNSISRRVRRIYTRIRFRLERSWRIQAAELIDALEIFDDLPADVLSELAGEVRLEEVPKGKIVVRQGDIADSFYIIAKGAVQAIEEHDDGTERPFRTLSVGESFGELALTEAAPRSATIRAIEDSRLFRIDKVTFDRLLSDSIHLPEFAATVQQTNQLRGLPVFSRLEPDELAALLDHGAWENVPPGEEIVREGDEGDSFYAVGSGRFEVTSRERGHLATLGPGDHFGEIALLMSIPRTASVTSITPSRVFRLSRDGFASLVADAFRSGKVASSASARVIGDRIGRGEGA